MRAFLRICTGAAAIGLAGGPATACEGRCGHNNYDYVPRAFVYYAPPPVVVYGVPARRRAYALPPAYSYYAPSAYEVYTRVDVYRGPRGSAYWGPPVVYGPAWTRGYPHYGSRSYPRVYRYQGWRRR